MSRGILLISFLFGLIVVGGLILSLVWDDFFSPSFVISAPPQEKEKIAQVERAKNTSPSCIINPEDLVTALKAYANSASSPSEDILVSIISKSRECTNCTKAELKVFLKLKMMLAIRSGNATLAARYMKQLDAVEY